MRLMNSRGQAFSTFQLLISAVVALAILVILLNILNVIQFPFDPSVSKEAGNMVKTQATNPGSIQTSSSRIIVKTGDSLNTKSLASQSGILSPNQLCLSKGDFESDSMFQFTDTAETVLVYSGNQIGVKLSVVCDTGTELAGDLQSYGITSDWMSSSNCENVKTLSQTACVVALRYA
ncbi:MAG: hypothetical protein AABW68_05000 [archaeon]